MSRVQARVRLKPPSVISSDEDDGEYTNSEASNSSALDDESASEVDITNEEVSSVVYHNINKCALISLQLAGSLASKTIPSTSTAKDSKKRKCPHTRRQGSSKHQPVKKTKQPTAEHDATIDEDQDPPNERNSASASHSNQNLLCVVLALVSVKSLLKICRLGSTENTTQYIYSTRSFLWMLRAIKETKVISITSAIMATGRF